MIRRCQVTHSADQSPVQEKQLHIQDPSGFRIQLEEISFNGLDLRWGSYVNHEPRVLSFRPDKKAIVSHFRIQDAGAASTQTRLPVRATVFSRVRNITFIPAPPAACAAAGFASQCLRGDNKE